MTGAAIALLWSIVPSALEIGGSATCPSPAQVETEIARRGGIPASMDARAVLDEEKGASAGTGAGATHGASATTSTSATTSASATTNADTTHGAGATRPRLRLQLFDAAGKTLGERTLLADADCQALAVTVATMLLSFGLDLGEAPPLEVPELITRPPVARPVRRSLAVEAGLGGFFSLTSDGAGAASALALVSLGIDESPFQPELAAEIESSRKLGIGTGLARWERLWVAPGLQYRFLRRPRLWASAHLDVPIGAALATGSNLEVDRSGSIFDFGVAGGIRLGLGPATLSRASAGRGGVVPWAGLWVIYWPLQPKLFLSNTSDRVRLPFLEMLAGVGLSWSGM